MEKTIVNIAPAVAETPRTKRVAAYARVSCGKDTMLHSLAAQIDYYRDYIIRNPEWRFAGVYADEAKTGTKDNREQFQLLLTECRSGNIDMVITKSISRFARNTVTLLETVRELKSLGIDVFFEEQNIYTMSAEGEVMLTLLASFAQEESLSVSDNCKCDGEMLYLFKLSDFELFVNGKKSKAYLPGEWREYFGTPVEQHEESYKINLADGYITTDKT